MNRKNKPGLLSRLFRRQDATANRNPVVAALYGTAIGRPLLVHPALGESLIGAYLNGAVDSPLCTVDRFYLSDAARKTWVRETSAIGHDGRPLLFDQETPDGNEAEDPDLVKLREESSFNIAVINVSGGLVDRPMPGECGPGPVSYEALAETFDGLMDDDTVHAIVLRLDTPGGAASGLFDLTDRMYARRGEKPLWAVVSDMAYSAGYALASVCDRVWVTRTGGVGSVGVVAYHEDWSAADAMHGIKVTAIYAGAHKVDFSPAFPLTEDAKAREQADVNTLYELFCDRVATYRGLRIEDVRATEALCFMGQNGIDVGFATDLGTFDHALAALADESANPPAQDPPAEDPPAEDPPAEDPPAEDPPAEDPPAEDPPAEDPPAEDDNAKKASAELKARVARAESLANELKAKEDAQKKDLYTGALFNATRKLKTSLSNDVFAALTAGFASAKIEEVEERVKQAKAVVAMCAIAKAPALAAGFVRQNLSTEQVREQLTVSLADEDAEVRISSALDPKKTAGKTEPSLSTSAIYAARRAAATRK